MLKQLMERCLQGWSLAVGTSGGPRYTGRPEACDAWRDDRDIIAIMASFGRLTDRQLAMLGVHRDEIQYIVAELLATAVERWKIRDEVAWMLEETPERGTGPAAEPSKPADADRDTNEDGVKPTAA